MDVSKILYEITDNELVFNPDCELIESGILDSYAFIELLTTLEDLGLEIHPTRIERNKFKTVKGIQELVDELTKE